MKTTWSVSAVSAIAMSVVAFGFANTARAQDLFVDGDIVRGNQPGAPGPICVLNNQFKHLEKVVFRFRVRDKDGTLLDDKGLKSLVVEMPDGQKMEGFYGGHPPGGFTDYFWVVVWVVPKDYPSGTFVYKATATDLQGHQQGWEPIKRVTSHLQIMPGEIEFKKP
jgi:hypothetical protein